MGSDDLLTLADLRASGRFVEALCRTCGREGRLHPETLIHKLGPHVRVGWTAGALRCSRCGSKDVRARPGERPRHPAAVPRRER